jgi:catechol 2,3-dioxygenase-like lactoylglutathione lyase family enzyme
VSAPLRPFHHLGYVVDDLPRAVHWAVDNFGAGPFFVMEHMPFDAVTFEGEPGTYDHSTALGQWGPVRLELTVVHGASPPGLAAMLGGPPTPRLGHVAWLAEDLEAESARLQAAGLRLFHTGRAGPVHAHYFDARATLGCHIEVHQQGPELLAFYELMRSSAEGWDGSETLRPAPGPDGP